MVNWKLVKELQEVGIDKILKSSKLKGQYTTLHKKIYSTNLCVTCNATIRHSFANFLQLTKPKFEIMSNRKYKFKKGVQIWVEADRVHYTNANLTDKVAKKLLESNSAYEKFFEEMPAKEKGKTPAPAGKNTKTLSQMNSTELNIEVKKLQGMTDEEYTKVEKLTNKKTRAYIRDYKVPEAPEAGSEDGDGSGKEDGAEGGDGDSSGDSDESNGENTEKE